MFYINQIVKVLPDAHDIPLPNYGMVNMKDVGYYVPIMFKHSNRRIKKMWVERSRVVESNRSDL